MHPDEGWLRLVSDVDARKDHKACRWPTVTSTWHAFRTRLELAISFGRWQCTVPNAMRRFIQASSRTTKQAPRTYHLTYFLSVVKVYPRPIQHIQMMSHSPSGSVPGEFQRNFKQLREDLEPSDPPTEEEDVARKEMIIREAKRAAVAWVVIYIIAFLCLLMYRWQTREYYQAEYERKMADSERKLIKLQNVPKKEKKAKTPPPYVEPWWTNHEVRVEEAKQHAQELERLQEEKLTKVLQQLTSVQAMKANLEQLNFSVRPRPKASRPIEGLKNLLMQDSLAEVAVATELDELFHHAIDDLRAIYESAETYGWQILQAYLSSGFPERVPSIQEEVVPKKVVPSVIIPTEAARISDLEELVRVAHDSIERRPKLVDGGYLVQALLPDTATQLEEFVGQGISDAFNEVVSTLNSLSKAIPSSERRRRESTPDSCVEEDDVLEILEEGLKALQQHADLRSVLRKKAMEMDPTATSIILDADLPIPTPRLPTVETVNLRRILETPLVLKLPGVIDGIVEMLGGYSDQVDQWLDSIVTGRESIGELVINRLLDESGKVEIPTLETAESRLPPSIQELLHKARKAVS